MSLPNDIAAFLRFYPQIYFACHRRHVWDEKARKKLSPNQASILDHLDSIEPISLRSLAKHMGVTASTMSLNVDRLERAGYVRRERDQRDARRVELRLTEAGNRLKQRRSLLDPALVGGLLKRVKDQNRASALQGLKLFADAAAGMIETWQKNNRRGHSSNMETKRNSL